jgi:outer membrane protein assembly factor BamB
MVIHDESVYVVGPQNSTGTTRQLDPMTGSTLAEYPVIRRACTRTTGGPDGIFFRAPGGSVRLDLASGKPQWISPMRPSCLVGVVISDGHLYWVPWTCDCNLQMFGVVCNGPAGAFGFAAPARDEDRLQTAPDAGRVAAFDASPADWPAYRASVRRDAATTAALPASARLLWERALGAASHPTAPVAAGGLAFVAGADGAVRALDAATGEPRWTAWTGGEIRYPPAVADGRVLVGSGDGWAYAFEAAGGRRLWRFRAAPAEQRISVYGGLVSRWPVATGVAVHDGVAYLAAGINNYDGTHVYALDAATGRLKWHNAASGHLDAFSRRGVAAQGDLLISGGRLFLAGGNAASPGVYDLADGRCHNPPVSTAGSQAPRGRELHAAGNGVAVSGQPLYSDAANPVFDQSVTWQPMVVRAAGGRLTLDEHDGAWTLAARPAEGDAVTWSAALPGMPVRWGVAVDRNSRVIVTLEDGRVMAYGAAQ